MIDEFARQYGWLVVPITHLIQSSDHQLKIYETVAYDICLVDLNDQEHRNVASEIEQIIGNIVSITFMEDVVI